MAGPTDQDKLADEWGLSDIPPAAELSEEAKAAAAAAEWAAMIEGEAGAGADDADRVLNQDEIDSLLGFDASVGSNVELTGVQALINSALVSYERLPMLEIVFDRLVRLATTSLRNFTSDNVEVTMDSISSVRFGDYLNSIPLPAILSVIKAEEWENYGLLTVDSSLIYSMIDVLLGGRRIGGNIRVEGRPYTTIEMALARKMIELILEDTHRAFEPVTQVHFKLERMETNPRFAAISR
ncbi:MAG TPA: flagellar motor switch protein FliM, partial [Devosia sp.]|nr:flagellar motor switch protein FliM [Devosia sp.]